MRLLLLFTLCFSSNSFSKTFLPENNLYLDDCLTCKDSKMTEVEFQEIIAGVEKIYAPIVKSHGAVLKMVNKWKDSTVNASAEQSGKIWTVNMYGGLARRPEVTKDGFALVVCHEIGHHLGGYAFYSGMWAANEGQSDYFAAHACAKKLWLKPAEELVDDANVSEFVKKSCDSVYSLKNEQNLCYRTAAASKSLADLLAGLGGEGDISFETSDTHVVENTNSEHPAAQCRLDTMFQASLCNLAFPDSIIPGKIGSSGSNNLAAQKEAFEYTCSKSGGHILGSRPACWFKELE